MFWLFIACMGRSSEQATAGICQNQCPDYTPGWQPVCPSGSRCIQVKNGSDTQTVFLSYQVGCNGDGKPGSFQCNCTAGPVLSPGESASFTILNGDYQDCHPYEPLCLTEGLALIGNVNESTCAKGTRVEFTAGNAGNLYGRFDSYNLDVQPTQSGGVFYSIPVSYRPLLDCAVDSQSHNCRPLFCDKPNCPDAYSTPTTGGCPDGRAPQVGCQDTFAQNLGFEVLFFPPAKESCQDIQPCNRP